MHGNSLYAELTYKEFKVASLSKNRSSFGLRGHVMVARDGETWEVAASQFNEKKQGEVLSVPCIDGRPQWCRFGFELPEHWTDAPPDMVAGAWGPEDKGEGDEPDDGGGN